MRTGADGYRLSRMHSLVVPLVHLLLTGVSVVVVAKILPGITVRSYKSAVVFALVVAILNALAWMIPITWGVWLLTFGLGMFLINGLVFLIAGKLVDGVQISGLA